jgi:hypothetical protein
MTDPKLVAVAGDWHKNERWALHVIPEMAKQLAGEECKIILHTGDFGVWREESMYKWMGKVMYRQTYLETLTEALEAVDAYLWFVDGNHENHPYIRELALNHKTLPFGTASDADVHELLGIEPLTADYGWITPRIRWLPRGTRWTWNGKTWLALGGAVSVDKNMRTEGVSWFPEEEITDREEASIIAETLVHGRADVILSHDAPSSESLNLGIPAREWLPMIPRAEAHRDRIERICAAVKPSWIFHGHYHMAKTGFAQAPWGQYEYTALDMDGTRHNWGILDTKTMNFFFPEDM